MLSSPSDPFITRGSHNTLSACTLPTWTPEEIMDSMNAWFGLQLRHELVKHMSPSLQNRPKVRTHSMDSQRLSIDSLQGIPDKRDYSENTYEKISWNHPGPTGSGQCLIHWYFFIVTSTAIVSTVLNLQLYQHYINNYIYCITTMVISTVLYLQLYLLHYIYDYICCVKSTII